VRLSVSSGIRQLITIDYTTIINSLCLGYQKARGLFI
jgi:hypothetical protein